MKGNPEKEPRSAAYSGNRQLQRSGISFRNHQQEPLDQGPVENRHRPESSVMTTEKDKDQTRQNPSSENQDPNRKAPPDHPSDPPTSGAPGSTGTDNSLNTTST